ncbi:leucine-rich repeat and calponin homology domain-containing protein isoform X2 [Spodoptera frugiperda]|uniref:Leucine-rich repeat and calponin homology domain-containing protein isoform X2 n=1 Tax=Spodoptera frugiperda TaxID=7108 RepID=A0A9R0D9Z6_SPOFR|nr:leucine-rich repeat and calponin homology domain-containing protein isoform X2 [Spodoptera frugiperda]
MAVLGPCVSVNMNGHNNIHSQLTKSLERILEDAYLSGELKLSGRKLREFPKPVKYDLSDTVVADLSKNRFSELPDELTSYVFLEKLLLSQNIIRTVPNAVGGLQSLTYLDLSSNQLTELPREVCQMPLQVLLVPDNMLSTLPKEIGKMTSLAELDASNNRLTQVPMTLGDCAGLRALDLSNNQLGLLPLQITYLRLEHLDVSCNCISSLPLELRNMNTIITLNLDNNPLVSPPTTICMRGRVHIFKYLENMANKDSLPAHRRVDETRRSAKHSSYINNSPNQSTTHQITSGNATIDCLRHKPRHVVDSGYSTDGVDKRWSNDGGGEAGGGGGSGRSTPSTPSTLSPGAALSRAQSLSSETPLAPLTPLLSGVRISPDGNMSNGDDKSKLAHQQTYRQYKEALRQQRQQDIYRPRTDQPSPELDSSPHSQNQSPIHQKSSHSPVNGYSSNVSPSLYKTASSNSSLSNTSSPNLSQVPNSPLLHSTPRRYQNQSTNGNGVVEKQEENKRPVQKVVPSRNVNSKVYSTVNGNVEYNGRVNGQSDTYIKPTSPSKSPTNTIGYNSLGKSSIPRQVNGDSTKVLTTSVSYLKGAAPKPPGKMAWNKDAPVDKLSFTMKREFDKQKEELDLLTQLRSIIESRLKMSLPEQLAPVLSDGVVLCHLANHVRPRSVASVHVPSPAQPKLTMARCRRNVDNFLEACRKIGVEEEAICSPEDILGTLHCDGDSSVGPLARTVTALLTHATPHAASRDIRPTHSDTHSLQDDYYTSDDPDSSIEVNYYQRQLRRYSEERFISNFNFSDNNQHYTIDESEEYLNNENNNTDSGIHYSPVYGTNELRNRGPYYQTNRVQFVTPFCKEDHVLKSDNFEIYDTDEVDFPTELLREEVDTERYDRGKMNLQIQNNLNSVISTETEAPKEVENKVLFTCLCLGTFFVSTILLIMYPL